MKPFRFLIITMLTAACATQNAGRPAAGGDVAISLSRDVSGTRPVVVVAIMNRSRTAICIAADALQDPYSEEMDVRLRDARGRAVRLNEPGFVPPPRVGFVRIEPGGTAQGRSYLFPRFRLRGQGTPFPRGMSVRVSFEYGPCDQNPSLRATSAWQPI